MTDQERAVQAAVDASRELLDPADAQRLAELAVFAEDEVIPRELVAALWGATASLDRLETDQVCARLAGLALITTAGTGQGAPGGAVGHATGTGVALHDVIRDILRAELGPVRLAGLHQALLDAVASSLLAARPLNDTGTSPDTGTGQRVVAWWELDAASRYVWDHLIEHLKQARGADAAAAVAGDLRWAGARLERFGPAAAAADLAQAGTPGALRKRAALDRAAHLLASTQPPRAVIDIMHSRVAEDPDWGPQVTVLRGHYDWPRLVNRWPLPDLASPALRRVLVGHASSVFAVAISTDGTWLATASDDGTARIWDADGTPRATLTGHASPVFAVAISPDGTWLVTISYGKTARIWDADGTPRATLTGHTGGVLAVAISPDGAWLATTTSSDRILRIWDVATGQIAAMMRVENDLHACAWIGPSGLAVGGTAGIYVFDFLTGLGGVP